MIEFLQEIIYKSNDRIQILNIYREVQYQQKLRVGFVKKMSTMGGYTVAIFQAELFYASHSVLECVSNDLVQTALEKINLIQVYEKI